MQISSFNRSKYRSFEAPGEDVLLILPGLYALFDGATDPTKTMLDGITSGRFAALTCAEAVGRLWATQQMAHDEELLHQVNEQLEVVLLQKTAEGQLQAEGKPPQAIDKIVQGKLDKYYSNSCLLEQPFVKDPDSAIKQLLKVVGEEVGSELKVESFIRFQVGEDS